MNHPRFLKLDITRTRQWHNTRSLRIKRSQIELSLLPANALFAMQCPSRVFGTSSRFYAGSWPYLPKRVTTIPRWTEAWCAVNRPVLECQTLTNPWLTRRWFHSHWVAAIRCQSKSLNNMVYIGSSRALSLTVHPLCWSTNGMLFTLPHRSLRVTFVLDVTQLRYSSSSRSASLSLSSYHIHRSYPDSHSVGSERHCLVALSGALKTRLCKEYSYLDTATLYLISSSCHTCRLSHRV